MSRRTVCWGGGGGRVCVRNATQYTFTHANTRTSFVNAVEFTASTSRILRNSSVTCFVKTKKSATTLRRTNANYHRPFSSRCAFVAAFVAAFQSTVRIMSCQFTNTLNMLRTTKAHRISRGRRSLYKMKRFATDAAGRKETGCARPSRPHNRLPPT